MRRSSALAAVSALGLVALSAEARAVVRVTLETSPPEPVAGQPFRLVYTLQVQNDSMAQATQLQFSGLTVLANAAPPSTANMMIGGFGGMGMFTVQSSAEYVLMAPNAGRFTVRGAGAVNPQTGRASAQLAP